MKYLIFAKKISKPVSFHDIEKIEKASGTIILLHQVVEPGLFLDIRLFRKGNNTSVHPDRAIHLCQIEEADHIILVEKIQKFVRCVRTKTYSISKLKGSFYTIPKSQ